MSDHLRTFRGLRSTAGSVPVGDNSCQWHDCVAWCSIPEPAPPAYATHGNIATSQGKPNCMPPSTQYGVRPQTQVTRTLGTTQAQACVLSLASCCPCPHHHQFVRYPACTKRIDRITSGCPGPRTSTL